MFQFLDPQASREDRQAAARYKIKRYNNVINGIVIFLVVIVEFLCLVSTHEVATYALMTVTAIAGGLYMYTSYRQALKGYKELVKRGVVIEVTNTSILSFLRTLRTQQYYELSAQETKAFKSVAALQAVVQAGEEQDVEYDLGAAINTELAKFDLAT